MADKLNRAIQEAKEYLQLNSDHGIDGPTDNDALDMLMDECGMMRDGTCTMAGTEYCDWDCPFSDEL